MGYGSSRDNKYRIYLRDFDGSDNWVDIKERRSENDKNAVQMAGVKIGQGNAMFTMPGTGVTLPADLSGFDFLAARIVRFERMIIAWSLKANDDDAEPMPLTEDTFRNRLDADVAEWLTDQIETYYQNRRPSKETFLNLNGASTAS
jgi:hypothetical protein